MNDAFRQLQRSARDHEQWERARRQLLSGAFRRALADYRELVRRQPAVPELWFEFGNAAAGDLDFPLANQAYRRARDLASRDPGLLGAIGNQYLGLRQLDDARACYENAVAADPDSVDARINLAVWFEKERRLEEAWDCIEACLARHPQDDQARYFRALLLHRRRQHSEAETALRDLIQRGPKYPYVKYAARHLLGVVLDELGQYEEAWRCLLDAKAQVRTITDTSMLERSYDEADRRRRELLAGLDPGIIHRWRQAVPPVGEKYRFAFLGGHPRSGTTLLEQILDANPDVLAFDESAAFLNEIEKKIQLTSSPVRQLDDLSAARRAGMRERYARSLLRESAGDRAARVLLDKNPSPTMSLALWLRVFPELKVIIALRDPRDVLVSCFFLNLVLNATNVNFLSLERTAKHYADLMDVWLKFREWGGFDWIESRYEDVVDDVAKEGRKVTEFLGLGWHPAQAKYHETARRKVLYAPTYHDVTQPVYRRAVGRWQRYAQALAPVQDRLAPYCRAFGYSA